MIKDIRDIPVGSTIGCDVLIIGAGAVGITMAKELDLSPLNVILLESGGNKFNPAIQALYESSVIGRVHTGVHTMRFRVLGGTTTRWAGQALPLYQIDFDERPWIQNSGWPIRREHLDPFYERARTYLDIPPFVDAEVGEDQCSHPENVEVDCRIAILRRSQFSPTPDFALRWGRDLSNSQNVQILLHANARELLVDPLDGNVHGAAVVSLEGHGIRIRAKTTVVASGGIESARILLSSDRHFENGLGNRHDLVGRFFQDHPGLLIGRVHPRRPKEFAGLWAPKKARGVKSVSYLATSPEYQRCKKSPHYSATIVYPQLSVPGLEAAKRLFRGVRRRESYSELRADIRELIKSPFAPARAAFRYFVQRKAALDMSMPPQLGIGGEQMPNRESRIHLGLERDAIGMRRIKLEWRLTECDLSKLISWAQTIAGEMERCMNVSVDLSPSISESEKFGNLIVDQGHHMGAIRMGVSEEVGVVNPNCEVFGHSNLFVASSAVFPTGGFSNPTFTAMALAIRLSDFLKRRFQFA